MVVVLEEALAGLAAEAGLDPEQVALVREVTEVCRAANAGHHAPGELAEVMVAADRPPARLEAQAALSTATSAFNVKVLRSEGRLVTEHA